MDEERASSLRLGSPLRPLLTYGVPYVGAGVWAFTRFPDQLGWTSELFARVFGLAAPFYEDLTHVEGYGEALDAAVDALEREPETVLDLCCGTGFAARQVQHAFPDAEVFGVDLSPEMVLMARREADEEGLDIEFEVDDARALQFEDESFDLVVSHNAAPFPEETMRVLRPSGTALTVWSFGGPWVSLAWPALAKRFRKQDALYADGFRAGPGFYGIVEKTGLRRRRHARPNGSGPPAPSRATGAGWERAEARRAAMPPRPAPASRGPVPVPPRPPSPPPSPGARAPGRSRATPPRPGTPDGGRAPSPPSLTPRPRRRPAGAAGETGGPTDTAGSPPPPPPSETPSLAKRPSARPVARGSAGQAAKPAARGAARAPAKPAAGTQATSAAKRASATAPAKPAAKRPSTRSPAKPPSSGRTRTTRQGRVPPVGAGDAEAPPGDE